MVDLLQRAGAPAQLRRPPAEHADRRAVRLGAGDRADAVGHPGPGGQRRDADPARRLRESLGGEGGRLLVADVDDLDPLGPAAVVDREKVPAGEREEVADAPRRQRLGDKSARRSSARHRWPSIEPMREAADTIDRARVAKLAKAAPLKGAAPSGACGFESRPGHSTQA